MGYYDGTDHGGVFPTNANNNPYGVFDLSGNVYEWGQDYATVFVSLDARALHGGTWDAGYGIGAASYRRVFDVNSEGPDFGLRVLRVQNCIDPCDDGNACTTNDACSGGTCVGGPPPNCSDGNVCTDDSCDPGSGCINTPNTAACDDGDPCTTNDVCGGGSCVGTPVNCDDGNPCTIDSCAAGACQHAPTTGTGDFNGDGGVDLTDYASFQACLAGPTAPLGAGCECGDMDGDADVDFEDFKPFQLAFSGAPPANDVCAGAIVIGDGTITGDTSASVVPDSASCLVDCPGLWYRYTAAATGRIYVHTCGSAALSGVDTKLAVFSGTCGGLVELGCNDDGTLDPACGGLDSELCIDVVAGQDHYILVSGYNCSTGAFLLTVDSNSVFCPVAPGDACSNALLISDGATPFDTTTATTDGPAHAGCQFDGQTYYDIWYAYTATCTGNLTVSTCQEEGGDASYDTDLVVYDGCACESLVMLGCNDDAAATCTAGGTPYASRTIVPVAAGNCYLIRVGSYSGGTTPGTGIVSIGCAVAP